MCDRVGSDVGELASDCTGVCVCEREITVLSIASRTESKGGNSAKQPCELYSTNSLPLAATIVPLETVSPIFNEMHSSQTITNPRLEVLINKIHVRWR